MWGGPREAGHGGGHLEHYHPCRGARARPAPNNTYNPLPHPPRTQQTQQHNNAKQTQPTQQHNNATQQLAKRLFDVDVVAADGKAQVWHPDVRFFEVRAANNGTPIAYLYVDPFARPAEKRGGAWMDSVIGRSALLAPKGQRVRLPVAVAVCNSAPPERPGAPALLTLRDVTTLFHEFGALDDGQLALALLLFFFIAGLRFSDLLLRHFFCPPSLAH